MVGRLVKADTIRARRGADAAWLLVSVELKVIEAGEVLGGRLLQRNCATSVRDTVWAIEADFAVASHPTPKGRAKTCPTRSSGASRHLGGARDGIRGQTVRPGSAAPESCRSGGARCRRGAGRLGFRDPCPRVSHPSVEVLNEETPPSLATLLPALFQRPQHHQLQALSSLVKLWYCNHTSLAAGCMLDCGGRKGGVLSRHCRGVDELQSP